MAGGFVETTDSRNFNITLSGLWEISPVALKANRMVVGLNVCCHIESIESRNSNLSNSLQPVRVAASTASV